MGNDVTEELIADLIMELNIPGLRREMICENADLREDLGIDSLNRLILLVRLQERLRVEFASLSWIVSEVTLVRDVINFVRESGSRVSHGNENDHNS